MFVKYEFNGFMNSFHGKDMRSYRIALDLQNCPRISKKMTFWNTITLISVDKKEF